MASDRAFELLRDDATDPVRWAFFAGVHLLGAQRASLLLSDGAELTVAAAIGLDPDVSPTVRIPIGQGIAGIAAERNVTLFGAAEDARFICVPIEGPHGVLGVVNLTQRNGADFDDLDVTRARELARHLAYLLSQQETGARDAATGLPGQLGFHEALDRELARSNRTGSPFVLLVLDMPGLAALRAEGREDVHEATMHRLADLLRRVTRPYDVVSRYDEERFALLFPHVDGDGRLVARRVTERTEEFLKTVEVGTPMRVGLVHCPTDGVNTHQLLERIHEQLRGGGGEAP